MVSSSPKTAQYHWLKGRSRSAVIRLLLTEGLGNAYYDVETRTAGGSRQATQRLIGGNAEFAVASGGAIIQGNAESNFSMKVVSTISAFLRPVLTKRHSSSATCTASKPIPTRT